MAVSLDEEEPNRDNIARLIEDHTEKWDDKKGGAWFIEDFMAHNRLWFSDFRKDLAKVIAGLSPKKLGELDEVKKYLLAYFKPKLLKPGAKPKNTPKPVKAEVAPAPKKEHVHYDYAACQEIVSGAASKNEAMSRLRKAGYANKDIANFMKCKPGRVSSGIRAYDMSQAKDKKEPKAKPVLAEQTEKKSQPKPPELW